MPDLLYVIGSFVVFSYLIPLVWFIIVYWRAGSWKNSYIGRTLMFEKLSFTLLILVILTTNFLNWIPYRTEIRLVLFLLAGLFLWLDVWNLHRVRHEGLPVIVHHRDGSDTRAR